MVVYPANSRHRVEPVTRGKRDAAVFWVQSMVRQAERRQMLYELDRAIQGLVAREPSAAEILVLTTVYNGLLREWMEV
jgi:PKHD-type hydroxylase